jgi:membrane-bound serine protease (ClpP class)
MTAFGLVLIGAAVLLVLAEAHLSTGGLIGALASLACVAGVIALLLASGASATVVVVLALCVASVTMSLLVLARRRILGPLRVRPRTGREALIGQLGVVRASGALDAQVFINGSLWRAEPNPIDEESELQAGERVVVERVNGLTLCVRKAEEWELNR